ncbi:MAG: hypothetical protein LCH73_09510 [Proteobacteria bacterium]|nr:hypothetical protein [Pseudomonadota bacterium]
MKHTWTAAALGMVMLLGCAGSVRVMHGGLGDGRVTSDPAGLDCTAQCEHHFGTRSTVVLTATAPAGSTFAGWQGDCDGRQDATCPLTLDSYRSVTARFDLTPFPSLAGPLNGESLRAFLDGQASVTTPARMLAAIDGAGRDFRRNWLLMAHSESLQTGTAATPRLIVVSPDARQMLSFTLQDNPGYPHASPQKVEFIEFDGARSVFRFHEIDFSTGRGVVSLDKAECAQCHAGRPNWDPYDSWGGLLPFNRDRLHKGSVEAAMMRTVLDLKGRFGQHHDLLDQLQLPPFMSRVQGGVFDTRIRYDFDDLPIVLVEPDVNTLPGTTTASAFYPPGADPSNVKQGGEKRTIVNSVTSPASDEGRGVDLFDTLTPLNAQRVAQELIEHPRTPVDVRPIALALVTRSSDCSAPGTNPASDLISGLTPAQRSFLQTRHGNLTIDEVLADTASRKHKLPKLKADLQLRTLRDMIQLAGPQTAQGTNLAPERLRQELFRRDPTGSGGGLDPATGQLVDQEEYGDDTTTLSNLRFFLEPLGVPVSKWSMAVHGRSRTYTFADFFFYYVNALRLRLPASLGINARDCPTILARARTQLANMVALPSTPRFADVRTIFSLHCLECHGQFERPAGDGGPYRPSLLPSASLHSDLLATVGGRRMIAPNDTTNSVLYQRISSATSAMPPASNGPMLSQHDIDLIRRWIEAGAPD